MQLLRELINVLIQQIFIEFLKYAVHVQKFLEPLKGRINSYFLIILENNNQVCLFLVYRYNTILSPFFCIEGGKKDSEGAGAYRLLC